MQKLGICILHRIMKQVECVFSNLSEPVVFRIGSCAKENTELIKASDPDDVWVHLDAYPSAHVIFTPPASANKKQLRTLIKRAAELCRRHTNSCKDNSAKSCYTEVRNLVLGDRDGSVTVGHRKVI